MKKRTFKVRFFYGYMDLSPFTYIWLTPNIGCGSAEAYSSGRWVFLLSPFSYIWLTPNIGCGSAEAN